MLKAKNDAKPVLYEVGIIQQKLHLEHEKKFKIKALGGLRKTHKSKMDKLSDAPLESMDAPTQREPKMGKV